MTVTIKLFGMIKSLANSSELRIDLREGSQVQDLVETVRRDHPEVGELLFTKKVLVSVNQEIAHWETEIDEPDEIALLPPFAGGGA